MTGEVSLEVLSTQLVGIDKLMAAEFRNVAEAIRAGDANSRGAIALVAQQVDSLRTTLEALAAASATHPAYADKQANAVRVSLEKQISDMGIELEKAITRLAEVTEKRLDAHADELKDHGKAIAGQTVRNGVIGAIGLASLSGVVALVFKVFGG